MSYVTNTWSKYIIPRDWCKNFNTFKLFVFLFCLALCEVVVLKNYAGLTPILSPTYEESYPCTFAKLLISNNISKSMHKNAYFMRNAHISGSPDSYIVVSTLENTGIEKKKVSKGPKGSTEKRKLWRCGDFFFAHRKTCAHVL